MRSAKRSKAPKKPFRNEKINKKRHKHSSKRCWGWNDDLSGFYIDDINEAIRSRKARRTEGKSCWKLVPKDSCEIYKDRKKRSGSARKRSSNFSSENVSNDNETRMEEDNKKDKKRLRKKKTKGNIQGNRSQPKKKRKRRSGSYYYYTSQSTVAETNASSSSRSSDYTDSNMSRTCHCCD